MSQRCRRLDAFNPPLQARLNADDTADLVRVRVGWAAIFKERPEPMKSGPRHTPALIFASEAAVCSAALRRRPPCPSQRLRVESTLIIPTGTSKYA